MDVFIRVFLSVVSRHENKRFARGELVQLINKNIQDKRISVNNQHINRIIKSQKQYEYDTTRKHYEFKEKTSNEDDANNNI